MHPTVFIACLVAYLSIGAESYYLPFPGQDDQLELVQNQGLPYLPDYEFRAAQSPPPLPPAGLYPGSYGFPPVQQPLGLAVPLPYRPLFRVPAIISPPAEIPLLIRLSDTKALLVPIRATYAFPGFIERLIQRIQTYYSVYNPIENLTVDRPVSPPATEPAAPLSQTQAAPQEETTTNDEGLTTDEPDTTTTAPKVSTLNVYEVVPTTDSTPVTTTPEAEDPAETTVETTTDAEDAPPEKENPTEETPQESPESKN